MRVLKLSTMLFILALSAGALASTASAANPEFLDNVTGNTFTGKSGSSKLKAGAFTVECKKDKVTLENGKVTGAKTIEVAFELEECSSWASLPTR